MEKHIKAMMETEARMHGLELDSRHNARDMCSLLYTSHAADEQSSVDLRARPIIKKKKKEEE